MSEKILIVGGAFGSSPKKSSIIEKLSQIESLQGDCINGGTLEELQKLDLSPYSLILWMPDISNDIEKFYPKKPIGSVLICSKVLRPGSGSIEAVSRIFRMNGNAVISVDKTNRPFEFRVIDALGNSWGNYKDLSHLADAIKRLYHLMKYAKRIPSIQSETRTFEVTEELMKFMTLNRKVADKASSMGGRYFGNCSTRCDKLFPSVRLNHEALVSPRNVDKSYILPWDMVLVNLDKINTVEYYGDKKPSIDTPVQLSLYRRYENINFMIHGHYYILGAPLTASYYPCGDLREIDELSIVINLTFNQYSVGAINLRNHGFFLYSSTIEEMEQLVEKSIFLKRNIGKERVKNF